MSWGLGWAWHGWLFVAGRYLTQGLAYVRLALLGKVGSVILERVSLGVVHAFPPPCSLPLQLLQLGTAAGGTSDCVVIEMQDMNSDAMLSMSQVAL